MLLGLFLLGSLPTLLGMCFGRRCPMRRMWWLRSLVSCRLPGGGLSRFSLGRRSRSFGGCLGGGSPGRISGRCVLLGGLGSLR